METLIQARVLTEMECRQIFLDVCDLRNRWIRCDFLIPRYTLGASISAYTSKNLGKYYQTAKELNLVLRENFAWLYPRLAEKLAELLQVHTVYSERYALPGFHIYEYSKALAKPCLNIHFDGQYEQLSQRKLEASDADKHISFTLAIELPKSGGGLNMWEIQYHEVNNLSDREIRLQKINEFSQTRPKFFYPYQQGYIVVHSGLQLHQVAETLNIQPTDIRITLQGHGFLDGEILHLYW